MKQLLFFSLIVFTMVLTAASCNDNDDTTDTDCAETTWYQDADGDGLGNPDVSLLSCTQPEGYVANDSDSDDTGTVTVDLCATSGALDQSTDAEISAIRQAMVDFRASLSESLREQASVCLDDERFYLWHNTPAGNRDGITYGDLTSDQLIAFKEILQMFLSADGYQKVYEITELSEGWLSDIMANVWDPMAYSIDMFGDPATSGSWGLQLDGHHCAINFLVHGDNVSMVPAFLGGEPAANTYNGISFDIFSDERDLALALYNGMTSPELDKSVSTSSDRSLLVGPADRNGDPDPFRGDYDYSGFETGIRYTEMSETTRANFILLMQEFVYNLSTSFADEWWSDIMDNIDDTYFVWIDDVDTPTATSQFYYRIYNPYLWAEFNTENVTGANSNRIEDWNHIHSITRIPNNEEAGGDYGIFASVINQGGPSTLYEHYAMADHHSSSLTKFDYRVEGMTSHHHDHSHTHHGHSHVH